jgi:peptide/nickel transport system permease protein
MLRYLARRILYAFPILFGVFLTTFALFYLTATPEQMARRNLSHIKNPTQQQLKDWLKEHGYDKTVQQQFAKSFQELMFFQLGKSDATDEDIWTNIQERAVPSLVIGGLIFFAALLTDVTLALFLAYFRGTYIDYGGTLLCVFLMSVSYLVYLIAGQYLLAKVLKYFPVAGWASGWAAWKFTLMPMAIGVISGLGQSVRLYRTFMLGETNQDYVRTARAKGVPEQKVLFGHVLKNASIPILTSVVASLPLLVLGSILMESFFSIPGLGGYTVDAIRSTDFSVVRAMVFLGSVLYIIGFTLTDISYALVDPRVRLE